MWTNNEGMSARDVRNRDPSLRKRALIGLEILQDFHKVNDASWEGGGDFGRKPGRIYLPFNGDTLGDHKNAYAIILVDSDRLEIRARNCLFSCMTLRSGVAEGPGDWQRVVQASLCLLKRGDWRLSD